MARESRSRKKIPALLALALGLGMACSPAERPNETRNPIARCDIEGLRSCSEAKACGEGVCFEGCCHAACASSAACAGAPGCEGFGCVCEEGACIPTSCSASSECGPDESCVGGSCEIVTSVEVVSCRLMPPFETLRSGSEVRYAIEAFDAEGERIVPTPSFTLEVSDPNRATATVDRITGGAEAGPVEVSARVGSVRCMAELQSHGEVAEGRVRFLVVDALSRLPIEGAQVQLEADPTPIRKATDASGLAEWEADALPPPPWTVSVFSAGHRYVSLFGVSERDGFIPLSPNPEPPRAGGFSGAFRSDLFEPSRLNFGLAGASIPGNLVDLDVFMLVGPIEEVEIDIGGARSADLSAGLVFGLGNTWFKERYRVEALPGACADKDTSRDGRCGRRTAWGLAGGIPLEDLPLDAIEGEDEVEAGRLLAELLPNIRRLRSAVMPSFAVRPQPRAGEAPDWEKLPGLDLDASKRLSLRADVRLGPLPSAHVDGVIALVGAKVLHEGLVPLGLTGALAEAGTREIVDPVRGGRGILDLGFAPLHGGIEGSEYVVFVLAVDLQGLSGGKGCTEEDRAGCTPVSGLLSGAESLPWGTEVDFSQQGFLGFAEEARFDPDARRLDVGPVPAGANLMRLEIVTGRTGWEVFFPASVGSIELPRPVDAPDRIEDAAAALQAMEVDLDLDALLAPGASDLADFTLHTRRFSAMDLPRVSP